MDITLTSRANINSKIFFNIFNFIKSYSETVLISFTSNDITIQTKDTASISIFNTHIKKEYFERFDVTKEYLLQFNINDLFNVFKLIQHEKRIELTIENDVYLKVIVNETEHIEKKIYKINSIITTQTLNDITKFPLPNTSFNIQRSTLCDILDQLFTFSDKINIKYIDNTVMFKTIEDNISTKMIYTENISHIEEKISNFYSLKYLYKLSKFANYFETVKIYISNKNPISINCNNDHLHITYIIGHICH